MTEQRLRTFAIPSVIIVLALAVRLGPWAEVYDPAGVRLVGDSDPHYHVLRAERLLHEDPGAPWRDPQLDWPNGADIPWPPLFDLLLAAAARLLRGPGVQRDGIAAVAASIPVLFGLGLVLLVARLGRRVLGEGRGWIGAGLVAVLPAATEQSELGRPDQHSAELVLFAAILLATLAPLRSGTGWRRPALTLVFLAPIAFWTWMGSALHLVVPLLSIAALWALDDDDVPDDGLRGAAAGLGGGALLLATSIALGGRPGALVSGSPLSVGGLHVALLAVAGAFPALLLVARRLRPGAASFARRGIELLLAASLPFAILFAIPAARAGVAGGFVALGAANAWYREIQEFSPLVHLWHRPLGGDLLTVLRGFGLAPLAAAGGAWAVARALRTPQDERAPRIALLVALAVLVPATLARRRFGAYATIPLAIAAEAGLRLAANWLAARAPTWSARVGATRIAPALAALLVIPSLPEHLASDRLLRPDEEATLAWMATAPIRPGREAVLAPWTFGHLIQYFCDRPVTASPFGSEAGLRSLEDVAGFWFATTGAEAEAVLARRRAGLVLLANTPIQPVNQAGHAPPGTPPTVAFAYDLLGGRTIDPLPAYFALVPNRLFVGDGRAGEAWPPLDGFRLLYESPATAPDDPLHESQWKVFEPVPGTWLVAETHPGGVVRARVELRTGTGRTFEWETAGRAGPEGVVRLRLPYASGRNGDVRAGPWEVTDGAATARLVAHEVDVLTGNERVVVLSSSAGRVGRQGPRQ